MKVCPECGSEYEDRVERCVDCDCALISSEDYEAMKEKDRLEHERLAHEEFVTVKVAGSEMEADAFRAGLEKEGLTVLVRTFEDAAYDGLFVAQKGWGNVGVIESQKERAEKIVEELERVFEEQGGFGEETESEM